jgi:VTC domain
MSQPVEDLLTDFDLVSLEALDERAALLRRVDNKYALDTQQFGQLVESLRDGHEVLDIDGRRVFAYSTTYFETPDLRCFTDHVEDQIPRFKARTRLYVDSGQCVFEVKLKRADDETDKRQTEYAEADRRSLTEDAKRCLRQALADADLTAPEELTPSLTTSFERLTFATVDGAERLTCDLGVRLAGPDGAIARTRDDLVLVETKSEHGDSPADRQLAAMGVEIISLSKYRVGMSRVGAAVGVRRPARQRAVHHRAGP